jgi:hypothetical protein
MLGRAEENQLMKELELRGSFFEMGRQYGKGCRKEIWLFSKSVQLMVALSERPGADLFDPQYRHLPREMVLFVICLYFPDGSPVLHCSCFCRSNKGNSPG